MSLKSFLVPYPCLLAEIKNSSERSRSPRHIHNEPAMIYRGVAPVFGLDNVYRPFMIGLIFMAPYTNFTRRRRWRSQDPPFEIPLRPTLSLLS